MKLVDANVLVYSVNAQAARHESAHAWWERALNSNEAILLPWLSTLAFVRLATNPRILPSPLPASVALGLVEGWLDRPHVVAPQPDERHVQRMDEILRAVGGAGGNLINDAHLAALAVQYGAEVVTYDSDFGRFPGVRWTMPAPAVPD